MKADIGLIGLAVMGENLAVNIESHGYKVAVYNRQLKGGPNVVDNFINNRGKGKKFIGTHTIAELMESVKTPRRIMMMVKSGTPVDELIGQLLLFMDPGDIIIDGGNSDFHDTERRVKLLESHGMYFIGTGVSGGEQGALHGPSIMPGGSEEAWKKVKKILQDISAKIDDENGAPCCEWMGKGGAGHFVKTVHNGIEYGDMQLIAESYALMKHRLHMNNDMVGHTFSKWNETELNSFLVEISAEIMHHRDKDGSWLIDNILDVAGQKGTGKWSAIAALDEGNPMTLITEAVHARSLSVMLESRQRAEAIYSGTQNEQSPLFTIDDLRLALYASKIVSYAQGFSLLHSASKHYEWGLNLGTIAKIWRNGCIIRSSFLKKITEAYKKEKRLNNLLFDSYFALQITKALPSWRKVVADAALHGIAIPAMNSALSYFDGLRTTDSPANLLQAQRDYFGAHTYERRDSERGRFFHTNWTGEGGDTVSGSYNA